MSYGDFKDLPRRTASDKVLQDKAFNLAEDPKCDGYQKGLASMVCKFLLLTQEQELILILKTKN